MTDERINEIREHATALTSWEDKFLDDMEARLDDETPLSGPQEDKMAELHARHVRRVRR